MPKRKIEEISGATAGTLNASDRIVHVQRQQLDGHLDQSKKALFRALKVARGFERQKLGRRQKTAKAEDNDADTTRLDAEVAALKSLDPAITAELHLFKTLLRINSIAKASALPRYVHTIVGASEKQPDGPSANVQARLFKSGPVQDSMAKALDGVRAILGIEEVKAVKKKRLRAKDYAETAAKKDEGTGLRQKVKQPLSQDRQGERKSDEPAKPRQDRREQREEMDHSEESEDDDIYDKYTARLASSSSSSSSSPSSPSSASHSESENPQLPPLDPEASTEDESTNTPFPSSHPNQLSKPPKPKRSKPPTSITNPPTSTTFLPSLTTGHLSRSSSPTSSEPQRKNRMGQQARRALWEKKFGYNANHVRSAPGDRDEGWDARRGASAGGRGRGGDRGGLNGGRGRRRDAGGRGGGVVSSGANSDPVVGRDLKGKGKGTAEGDGEGALHPSWEAARKAKEQKKAVAFQGKKVVFD